MVNSAEVEHQAEQAAPEMGLLLEQVQRLEEDTLRSKLQYETEVLLLRQQLAAYGDCLRADGLEGPSLSTYTACSQRNPALEDNQNSAVHPKAYSAPPSGLLSLPTEVLDLVCQYAGIKSCLQPGRRLYIPPSCYYCTSFQLFEVPCPGLLLCCKELYCRLVPFFYENSAVVVELDFRRCDHESSMTHLIKRASIHPYIHNVDLTLSTSARDRAADDNGNFWRETPLEEKRSNALVYCRVDPQEDYGTVIPTLKANLPKLKSFSWTIKISWSGVVRLQHTEADCGDSGYAMNDHGPPFLSYYRSPFSILEEHLLETRGRNNTPSLRIWLARSAIHKLARDLEWHMTRRRGSYKPISKAELVFFMGRHPLLTPIIKLFPYVSQFDLFHALGCRFGFFETLRRYTAPQLVMQMVTSVCHLDEFDELELLEKLLKAALSRKEGARFWHRAVQSRPLLWCNASRSFDNWNFNWEETPSIEDFDFDSEEEPELDYRDDGLEDFDYDSEEERELDYRDDGLEDSPPAENDDSNSEVDSYLSNTANGPTAQVPLVRVCQSFPSLIVNVDERVYELF